MRLQQLSLIAAVGMALCAGGVRADVFDLTATGTSSSVEVGGSSLPKLVEHLTNTEGEFQNLNGQAFNASLKYGGVNNAILFSDNASGTSATLTIPSTGFSRTFTGATQDDVQKQIKDFLTTDGSAEYAKFLKEINKQSLLGVVDGNPRATTAIMSDHAFESFGLHRTPMRLDDTPPDNATSNFRVDLDAGYANNSEANESYFTGAIQTGFTGQSVGLTFATIANYRDVDSSSLFSLGFELGLPITIIRPVGDRGLSWTITPVGSVSSGASYDLAAGGTMWGVGVTSSLGYKIGPLLFTLADQITYYDGFSIDIGNYTFDTDVNQEVVKNGLDVAYSLGFGYVDASLAYTNFLRSAAVDGYLTPSVGFGLKFGDASGLRIAYKGDFGNNYTSNGGEISLYFGY